MKRAAGFSLYELVAVIVIAGILAAIAIPRLTDSESKATWFHEEVKAGVRYAQRQAVAQRRCVFVQVASSTQVKLLYGDSNCTITATPLTFLATMAQGKAPGDAYVLDAPGSVTISGTINGVAMVLPASFRFNGLGQPTGSVVLSVGGKSITVTSETGYVQ
jgi:MSHA pilin protein MshC